MARNESSIIAAINWESERLHQGCARTCREDNTQVGIGSAQDCCWEELTQSVMEKEHGLSHIPNTRATTTTKIPLMRAGHGGTHL